MGILCLVGAVYLYAEINALFSFPQPVLNAITNQFSTLGFSNTPTQPHLYSQSQIQQGVQGCNTFGGNLGALGDFRGVCAVMQAYYYSPWILGIIGIVLLVKSRSHYYGSRKNRYQ